MTIGGHLLNENSKISTPFSPGHVQVVHVVSCSLQGLAGYMIRRFGGGLDAAVRTNFDHADLSTCVESGYAVLRRRA